MVCETCPATLRPCDRRAGRRRCKACCRAKPKIVAVRPTRKGGHGYVSQEWATPVGKLAKPKPPKAPPTVSWWLDAPRDGFTKLAEKQPKRDTDKVRLQELTV